VTAGGLQPCMHVVDPISPQAAFLFHKLYEGRACRPGSN
jgi:hypothetical protein